MSTENKHRKQHTLKTAVNIITAVFWGAFIIICLVNRDKITVDSIVSFTPSNIFLAIGVMLLLYAVKSVSVFIYGGLLYAACGIMFDLPLAIIINTAGTVIMTSVPYFIGKKAGKGLVEKLIQKKPKLEAICRLPAKNGIFVSFLVRMIGLLPADFVGMYLGAVGIKYSHYLLGTVIGLFPSVVAFSVMGMSADDPTSPQFIISLVVEIVLMLVSVISYWLWLKHKNKKST